MYILLDVSGTYFARNQPLGGTISAPINQEFNINVAGIIQISAVPTSISLTGIVTFPSGSFNISSSNYDFKIVRIA